MKYFIFLFYFIFKILSQSDSNKICTVLQDVPSKPNPSLVQCYRNNPNSCCNSVVDEEIKESYSKLLSSSCYRKFPELESYFCYPCNPLENLYTNNQLKTITICKSYLEKVWGENLGNKSLKYDRCGMRAIWTLLKDPFLPSEQFQNGYEMFQMLKPPTFENYTIIISDDEKNCFNFIENLNILVGNFIFIIGFIIFG